MSIKGIISKQQDEHNILTYLQNICQQKVRKRPADAAMLHVWRTCELGWIWVREWGKKTALLLSRSSIKYYIFRPSKFYATPEFDLTEAILIIISSRE